MSIITQQNPLPGYLVVAGPNNNENPVYAQPIITNIPGFPSSFAGSANANIVVNSNASAITFLPGDSLAINLTVPSAANFAGSATTEILYTNQVAGSLSYNGATGDVLVSLTGWYLLSCTIGETTPNAGDELKIALSNGAGAIASVLALAQYDGIVNFITCSCVAKLTQGQTVGSFFVNSAVGVNVPLNVAGVNFSIKYIA